MTNAPRWAPGPPGGWRRDRRHPPIGLAAVIGLVQVFGVRFATHADSLPPLAYALLLAGPAALLLRGRLPALSYALAAAATVAYAVSPYPRGPYLLAGLVALFVAVRAGQLAAATGITAASWLAYVLAGRLIDTPELRAPSLIQAVLTGLLLVVLLGFAEAGRGRRERFAQRAEIRAEQARAEAEQRKRQASEERLRIAQELHDVIGHHLSLINVQAGVGLHLMDSRPEQARDALTAIKQASAEALREVRSVLGALRPADEAAPRAPAPSLDRTAELVADAEAAGLPVALDVQGARRPLPAEVDRAAYRIVQEALTNIRRHAGPGAQATIIIGYAESTLTVRVADDGTGADSVPPAGLDGGGAGLPGMRERATALGGSFAAGPRAGGGFEVRATLPVDGGVE
ncbi:MAG TPA: sensor histidine kinase [Micromonosporaceae bacterium]|nr:sensor histidine kinase [Micromonosporaceae bacterium]